jgi:hypothetical protein
MVNGRNLRLPTWKAIILEVTVFDYVEGKEDPIGSGVIINLTKLYQ